MLPEEIEGFYLEVKVKLPIAKKKAKMMANGYPIDFLLGDFGDEFVE